MAPNWLGLDTTSAGESRDGDYWQSKRAKDEFQKVNPANNNGPNASRTDGPKPTQNPPTLTDYPVQLHSVPLTSGTSRVNRGRSSQDG